MYLNKNANKGEHKNLYQRIDDSLMWGTNRVVRTWNWTTGRTKVDLANTMLFAFGALALGSALLDKRTFLFAGYSCAIVVPVGWIVNKDQERREEKAIEIDALDISVEEQKNKAKFLGPFLSSPSVLGLIRGNVALKLMELSCLPLGSQFYIMRADYLPPRKNAFARGWKKVRGLLRMHVPLPVPVPVDCRYTLRV